MEPTLDSFYPLPREYSVVIYYRDSTKNYVLEVLKRKGFDLGKVYLPKGTYGQNLTSEFVEQLKATGIDIGKLERDRSTYLVYGATTFVRALEPNHYFNDFLDDIRRAARMQERTDIV